ncbi:MAG TPA: hypothetical protein PKJ28_07765 [Bacteroidales bacterium]|nr:hypothetical protein [Bacteroidales bacterium]HPS74469.1 hypothetical protein [Bacteroidales bacterium]
MKKIFFLFISLAFLASCDPEIDEFKAAPGNADFTRFIVVGHSIPAGYANGALYTSGQENSVSNILSKQLMTVGASALIQPMVTSEYGVYSGKRKLGYTTNCAGVTSLGVVPDEGPLEALAPVGYSVTNLSVPGLKSWHALFPHMGDFDYLAYGAANPYYCRFATNPANRLIDEIPPLDPTFFLLWLGDNDILSYATSGAESDSITPVALFRQAMEAIVQTLTANGAKGVISTVTDVTTSPFFTTIPYNGLVLTQGQADSINIAMTMFGLPFRYIAGANPFLISDPASTHPYFKVRQMTPGEIVLLTVPQDSLRCAGWGILNPNTYMPTPIPDQYILTEDEVAEIQSATTQYNAIIRELASTYGLAVVDMDQRLKELKSGMMWDGVTLSTTFVTGGVFSCDGIHLTPRGNAMAANFIIDAINNYYGSVIPHANTNSYPGLVYP